MAYDQLMQTYLGVGLLAARPSAPNVKAGVAAFYYATDTPALYVWDGSVWHTLASGSTMLAADTDVAIASPADTEVLTYVAAAGKWENKPAPGGTSGALKKLDEVTVGVGGAAAITFSGIDQTFRHLMLVLTARSDQSGNPTIGLTFNGDTAANYDYHKVVFSGTSGIGGAESYGATSILCGDLLGTGLATTPGGHRLWIYNYADTNWHKVVRSDEDFKYQNSTPGALSVTYSGWWRSTSAITSVILSASSGLIAEHSVASLYGVV